MYSTTPQHDPCPSDYFTNMSSCSIKHAELKHCTIILGLRQSCTTTSDNASMRCMARAHTSVGGALVVAQVGLSFVNSHSAALVYVD